MNQLTAWLLQLGFSEATVALVDLLLALGLLLAAIIISVPLSSRLLVPLLERSVRHRFPGLNGVPFLMNFFRRLSRLLPFIILYAAIDLLLPASETAAELIKRLSLILFVLVGAWVLDAFLQVLYEIGRERPAFRNKPVRGYLDGAQIVLYILAAIFAVSVLTGQPPWGVFTVLGGLTAVLLLIFKDTILGFVANLRFAANDLIRVGDWIEMPKYDADGDVIDVSIHTIKIRNWDRTITSIPTYVLISDHFKNWRGMQESGGRRIKRAILLDLTSIKFCTADMLDRFARISLISDYVRAKQEEIELWNRDHVHEASQTVNGRRQTNIGVFRAYCLAYLRANPKIHQEMIVMVRQLNPTPQGLPLEIYAFANDIAWVNYEGIQADIFDHLLAAASCFDLRLFQSPSGHDLRNLLSPSSAVYPESQPLWSSGSRRVITLNTEAGE